MDLQHELSLDPENIGYQTHIDNHDVHRVARIINDKTRYVIQRASIQRDEFLIGVAGGIGPLMQADEGTQGYYTALLGIVKAADSIRLDDTVRSLVQSMSDNNVLTQQEVDSLLTRPGSRAEKLWGAGTHISERQIASAAWGDER